MLIIAAHVLYKRWRIGSCAYVQRTGFSPVLPL